MSPEAMVKVRIIPAWVFCRDVLILRYRTKKTNSANERRPFLQWALPGPGLRWAENRKI